jgi:hypothetical protein
MSTALALIETPRRATGENLQSLLRKLIALCDGEEAKDGLTISELMECVGRRAYGPLLLVIGLFSISPATIVPGMTWLSALLTLLIAGQMALGLKKPWLPRKVLNTCVPDKQLKAGLEKAQPWAARIDAVLKPRLEFLVHPPFVNGIAVLCVLAALITFPLGLLPLAPLLPGAAVVFFGLGMMARDGLMLALGGAAVTGACALAWPLLM